MKGDTYTTGSTTYTNTTDTTVSITGSTFINCQAGDQVKYIYETDTDVTTFNFIEENNTVLNNATIVSTKDDLLALSAKALTSNNSVAEEATIVINADIDMQGADFSAIIAQRGDKLTVVGNGHKISNVKVVSGANDNTTGQASMFYTYPNSTLTVSNLLLENITVTADANGSGYAAAVVGYAEGNVVLNNVDVVNATVTGVKSSGMLVGHLSGSLEATDCDLSGTVTLADFAEEANGHYAGKYIGTLVGAAELNKCTVNATVSGNLNAANSGDVYGRATAAGSIKINGKNTVSAADDAAFDAAIANGAEAVTLGAGNYSMPGTSGDVTISGTKDTVIDLGKTGADNATFNGVTVKSTGYYGGLIDNDTIVYNDCTIDGTIYLYGEKVVFNNCTFDLEDTNDYIWVYATKNAEFNNCTFNTMGKAILVFQDGSSVAQTVKVEGCTFNASAAAYNWNHTIHISAVSMDGSQGGSYNVILNNNDVDSDFNGLWQDKTAAGNITVTVDGATVLAPNP